MRDRLRAAAAYWGRTECVEALIEAGAKPNLKLENGLFGNALQASRTAIDIPEEKLAYKNEELSNEASWRRDKAKVVELLLRNGACY